MKKFDLFAYLDQKENKETFIYRCGYYIVNKNCNITKRYHVKDIFYSVFQNLFLKFEVMEKNDIQYFNVYKLRNLTEFEVQKTYCITCDLEDIDNCYIDIIMNIENFHIL